MEDSPKKWGAERRKFKRKEESFTVSFRIDSPLLARLQFGSGDIAVIAQDVSEGGVALLTTCQLPLHAWLTMKFIMFNEAAAMGEDKSKSTLVEGEVFSVGPVQGRDVRLGVRFHNLSQEDHAFIKRLIELSAS